jgi:hypothetical protein
MTVVLSKTTTVLRKRGGEDGRVRFVEAAFPGEDLRGYDLSMGEVVWRELGSPRKLTVTLEPGDRLNDGEVV